MSELEKLLNNDYYYSFMKKEQIDASQNISTFDGKCMERIADIVINTGNYLKGN